MGTDNCIEQFFTLCWSQDRREPIVCLPLLPNFSVVLLLCLELRAHFISAIAQATAIAISKLYLSYQLFDFSRKNSQVSRFPAKSPDSRNNFFFVPKQCLLELSPPVFSNHALTVLEFTQSKISFWRSAKTDPRTEVQSRNLFVTLNIQNVFAS